MNPRNIVLAIVPACSLFLALPLALAEVLVIDDFEYGDKAALQAAWQPGPGTPPAELWEVDTPTRLSVLRMPCPFSAKTVRERVYYDRRVDLNLVRFGVIALDFYADDPAPVRNGQIYFRAQTGWYGASFPVETGWNRIRLGKAAFHTEGNPAGWDKIDAIRIAVWKSRPLDTFCGIARLEARSEPIVIVAGRDDGAEARTTRQIAERVGDLLTAAGVPHGIHSSQDVIAGALEGRRLAIFAYSPGMSDAEARQVHRFLDAGGRVIFFYSLRNDLVERLGLARTRYRRAEQPGAFASIVFESESIEGLPESMHQGSWNITAAEPIQGRAQVIGWWRDAQQNRGAPAVILSDRGAFMGHILTADDATAKQWFLLALVAHFEPSVWRDAAEHAASGAARIGSYTDPLELAAFVRQRAPRTPHASRIADHLSQADALRENTETELAAGRYRTAIARSHEMHRALADAYLLAHRPRDGEFRAVWNHSGTGDLETWDEAMRRLADANFNAVVPNMWWGGVAHYASDLLPRSRIYEERGDQIAQAVESGRRYGIEVHPWKVNYNLGSAPEAFVQRLRDQGRLQRTSDGQELPWLCPSHPDNQQLEIDTMVEVVRNYDVDGVHFDYIRYPHEDACYCPGCRQRFEAHLGRPVDDWPHDCRHGLLRQSYRDWRCDQITIVVRDTAEAVRQLRPHVRLSAAVFNNYPATKDSIGQDWLLWCREGWLDFVCPMNYTTSSSSFRSLTAAQVGHLRGHVPLYTGIGHWRISDEQALGQADIARAEGADGFILFNMGAVLAEQGLPKFGRALSAAPAVAPHNGPRLRFTTTFDNDQPLVEVKADTVSMTVSLLGLGHHRKPAADVTGRLQMEDMYGEPLAELADLPEVGREVVVTIPRQESTFRVGAVGELVYADGATQRFVARSRPYRFRTGPDER